MDGSVHPKPTVNIADGNESHLLKPRPPPGSYVIKVPKDQIFRVPPPENDKLFQSKLRRSARARRCGSPCLLWSLALLSIVLIALIVSTAVVYLVFKPKFTLDSLRVKGFTKNPIFSPEFDISVRADNRNENIGIRYGNGGVVTVSYSNVPLGSGDWPEFYQGAKNETFFRTTAKGSGVQLSTESRKWLEQQEDRKEVPLEIDADVPVRLRCGCFTSWKMKIKVRCHVVLDKLTTGSRIVSKSCRTKL